MRWTFTSVSPGESRVDIHGIALISGMNPSQGNIKEWKTNVILTVRLIFSIAVINHSYCYEVTESSLLRRLYGNETKLFSLMFLSEIISKYKCVWAVFQMSFSGLNNPFKTIQCWQSKIINDLWTLQGQFLFEQFCLCIRMAQSHMYRITFHHRMSS